MTLFPIRFPDADELDSRWAEVRRAGSQGLATAFWSARNHAAYEGITDLATLAAIIMNSVNRNHSLVDGNKRASVIIADDFLRLNGKQLGTDQGGEYYYDKNYERRRRTIEDNLSAKVLYQIVMMSADGRSVEHITERLNFWLKPATPIPFEQRYPIVISELAK